MQCNNARGEKGSFHWQTTIWNYMSFKWRFSCYLNCIISLYYVQWNSARREEGWSSYWQLRPMGQTTSLPWIRFTVAPSPSAAAPAPSPSARRSSGSVHIRRRSGRARAYARRERGERTWDPLDWRPAWRARVGQQVKTVGVRFFFVKIAKV